MDRLSDFLRRFELRARTLHDGPLERLLRIEGSESAGCLHVLRYGSLCVNPQGGSPIRISEPSVLFFARATSHELVPEDECAADLLSATVEFGAGDENPVLRNLPLPLYLPLGAMPDLDDLFGVLFSEAQQRRCGHAAVVDRLLEVLVVKLLRVAIERKMVDRGVVAGLADARLVKVLTAVHASPQAPWTLRLMAERAGMSRSRFAAHFSAVMGMPPAEYVKRWRVGLAKRLLRGGYPIKHVALEVGYVGSATFGRAFGQVESMTPSAWLASQDDSTSARLVEKVRT